MKQNQSEKKIRLGVNIDHSATLRQARKTNYPDPVIAALLAERAGCDAIVAHLREDRRHIQDRDVVLISKVINIDFNLEMSVNKEIVDIAVKLKPDQATLVPEKRQELTTEGGLDLFCDWPRIETAVKRLQDCGVKVSLFLDPQLNQIEKAKKLNPTIIEINTGRFSEAKNKTIFNKELARIKTAVKTAKALYFFVAAGHGLDYDNVKPIAAIKEIEELNIGHSIISRALFIGLPAAVKAMIEAMGKSCKF
jgi:pyridoxine 5-phosphate synthase